MPPDSIERRVAQLDWEQIRATLEDRGYATTASLLTPGQCAELVGLYDDRERFRSRVDMARLRFGVGEYKYFNAPLPPIVAALREATYRGVVTIANDWMTALRFEPRLPATLGDFLERCHRHGQVKPTPLMLRYETGGYNCLHQDLYGDVVFPLQFTVMLSRPNHDFAGGEFILVEQRPRAQSRGDAIALQQGEAILFPTRYRPIRGARGWYRINVRHGVSRVSEGRRLTLGIIFHDAK
jgi:hypothetical protein